MNLSIFSVTYFEQSILHQFNSYITDPVPLTLEMVEAGTGGLH